MGKWKSAIGLVGIISVNLWLALVTLADSEPGSLVMPAADSPGRTGEPPKPEVEEIIVTASRHEMKVFEAPYIAKVITSNDIQNRYLSRTTPEIFSMEPSVTVQKTAQGMGSPFLRGFTGFRTLFLIDGIRLNNSAFRDGPNEYWNTVDAFTIDRLEVVKGSGSVLYGSDAVGGTVNALTISPKTGPPAGEAGWHPGLTQRYASADKSSITRLELNGVATNNLGFTAGGSFKDFNDFTGGRHIGLQPKTGYGETDYDFKWEYLLTPHDRLVLAHQNVDQPDVWRVHPTIYGISWHGTTIGNEKKRILDHQRQLTYLQFHKDNPGWLGDKVKFSLSYQVLDEQQDRVRSNDKREFQGFDVNTIGFFTQMERKTSFGYLTYGGEFYRDNVNSFMRKYKADGSLESIEIQGSVADDATYDLLGVYLQDEYPLNQRLNLTAGIRYTQAKVDADKVKDPTTSLQISLSDKWPNVVGNLRLSYLPTERWNIFGGISQGFRAPNLSDLTRFDPALSYEIETPSPGLKPEKYLTTETGVKTRLGNLSAEGALFYTAVTDMIVRYATGNTVLGYNEVQKANVGDGFIYGGEFNWSLDIGHWSLFNGVAWQRGEVDTYPTSAMIKARKPMQMIPPTTGILGARWSDSAGKQWLEANLKSADRQDRVSPLDQTNYQRIPPDGTPGYTIYNLRGGVKLNERFQISVGVENITNRDYRIHGSGNNEPGTNFIISLDGRF